MMVSRSDQSQNWLAAQRRKSLGDRPSYPRPDQLDAGSQLAATVAHPAS
jgi:hypothetical protein